MKSYTGITNRGVGRTFGGMSCSVVGKMYQRFRARLKEDGALQRKVWAPYFSPQQKKIALNKALLTSNQDIVSLFGAEQRRKQNPENQYFYARSLRKTHNHKFNSGNRSSLELFIRRRRRQKPEITEQ